MRSKSISNQQHRKNLMDRQGLIFSAHSLQTYVDCHRRFELSYLEGLVWPAVEREPVLESEKFLENGRIFHEMVHQDILGIPVANVSNTKIAAWWERFKASRPADIDGDKYPEKTLVGQVGSNILVATYDLIVIQSNGKAIIFDWKTWQHPGRMKEVEKRLQSRIYPYLLVQSASSLVPGLRLQPEDIEMRYWFTEQPDQPKILHYNELQYLEDQAYLEGLVNELLQRESGDFALTSDEKKCKYCPYRSFCDRGDVAGRFDDDELMDDADMAVELLGDLDDYEAVAF